MATEAEKLTTSEIESILHLHDDELEKEEPIRFKMFAAMLLFSSLGGGDTAANFQTSFFYNSLHWNRLNVYLWLVLVLLVSWAQTFIFYFCLKTKGVRFTVLSAQFLQTLIFFLYYYESAFYTIQPVAQLISMYYFTTAIFAPLCFTVQWFRTELRFLVNSSFIIAHLLQPYQWMAFFYSKFQVTPVVSNESEYSKIMVVKGFFALFVFIVLALSLRDPTHYPNTMSSIPLEQPLRALKIPLRSYKFLLILLSFVLAYLALFLQPSSSVRPRPYYCLPICVAFNLIVLLLLHRKMRQFISITYKVFLIINHVLTIATVSLPEDVQVLYILHMSLYFLLVSSYVEFGFQLLFPLHTIYVVMVQNLTQSIAYVGTIFVQDLFKNSEAMYIAFGVITGVSAILALLVRTYFLPI